MKIFVAWGIPFGDHAPENGSCRVVPSGPPFLARRRHVEFRGEVGSARVAQMTQRDPGEEIDWIRAATKRRMRYHKLSIWMLNDAMSSWTLPCVSGFPKKSISCPLKEGEQPFKKYVLWFFSRLIFLFTTTDSPFSLASSISISAVSLPCWTKSPTAVARARTFGEYPKPRQMAHTIVDLPDPLGPMTRFMFGPG